MPKLLSEIEPEALSIVADGPVFLKITTSPLNISEFGTALNSDVAAVSPEIRLLEVERARGRATLDLYILLKANLDRS